jgi:hypothetical protein
MKTQLAKPVRSKARYSDQYKQEALELWRLTDNRMHNHIIHDETNRY